MKRMAADHATTAMMSWMPEISRCEDSVVAAWKSPRMMVRRARLASTTKARPHRPHLLVATNATRNKTATMTPRSARVMLFLQIAAEVGMTRHEIVQYTYWDIKE